MADVTGRYILKHFYPQIAQIYADSEETEGGGRFGMSPAFKSVLIDVNLWLELFFCAIVG